MSTTDLIHLLGRVFRGCLKHNQHHCKDDTDVGYNQMMILMIMMLIIAEQCAVKGNIEGCCSK